MRRWVVAAVRCSTVQRSVGTCPRRALLQPVPPSTIGPWLTSPRLTRSSTARHASLVSPPMFLTANSTFWPSSRTPSTTRARYGGLPVEPTRTTVPSNQADNRLLGQRAGVPGIPIALSCATPGSPYPCRRHRQRRRRAPAHPTRVGSGKIGAAIVHRPAGFAAGRPGGPCSSLRRLACRGVEPSARTAISTRPKVPAVSAIGDHAVASDTLAPSAFSRSALGRRA